MVHAVPAARGPLVHTGSMRACVVGSTNVDLVVCVPHLPVPGATVLATSSRREAGGKGANQASALAWLGADVDFVSAVGDDDDGVWSLAQLASAGVDTSQVLRSTHAATGQAVVMVDPGGENAIVVSAGANALVTAPGAIDAEVVLLTLEVPLAAVTQTALLAADRGVPVVLNAAPAQDLPAELLSAVSVLVVNEQEWAALGGNAHRLFAGGPFAVVVTLGSAGCRIVEASGERVLPAERVDVVDTTGAGDCFAAALAFGTGRGWPLERSCRLALAAGATSVTHAGARGGHSALHELGAPPG